MITQFEQYVKLNKKVPPEILTSLAGIEQASRLADTVAAHMSLKLSEKQKSSPRSRMYIAPGAHAGRHRGQEWTCCRSKSAYAAASSSR